MRRRGAGFVLAVTLAATAVAVSTRAQDAADRASKVHYWPNRVFSLPVEVAVIERVAAEKGTPVPTHLQLYTSLARAPWQPAGAKKALNSLDPLPDGKKGLSFTADRDGEYEFTVLYHHKDGSTSPKDASELAPMLRVVIDTTLPTIRLSASGNGVEWSATDDNLDPDGIRLQAKFPHWAEWKTEDNRAFRPNDRFAWKLDPKQVLEVRVMARDRAGNENYSAPVQIPSTGAFNTGLPKFGSDFPIQPGGGGGGAPPQPRIDYVNNPNFDIDYRIDRAGRSGIHAAQLYVQKQRGGWEPVKRYPIEPPATTGQNLKLAYRANETEEGVYGFFVAPESGAGTKADPPGPNALPMVRVVYDKTKPFLKITGVRVGAGGVKGPEVEIAWETFDQNLLPNPITLEYALDKSAVQWRPIGDRLAPGVERPDAQGTRRYVGQFRWEVPDETLWKFYVRARSVDMAGNSETDVRQDPVIVDLEKPAASITGVRGSGDGPAPGGGSGALPESPPTRPQPPTPAPKTNPPIRPMTTPMTKTEDPVTPPGGGLPSPAGPILPDLPKGKDQN